MRRICAALSLRRLLLHDGGNEAAQVVLEVIDAPVGIHLGVLFFVAERAFVVGAGLGAGRGVDAELEALGVDVVGERFHVRELGVGVEDAAARRACLPRCRRC